MLASVLPLSSKYLSASHDAPWGSTYSSAELTLILVTCKSDAVGFCGAFVGTLVGTYVGEMTSFAFVVGACDSTFVGVSVGVRVGLFEGALVGAFVGAFVGVFVGAHVGLFLGASVGARVGLLVGDLVGALVGDFVKGFAGTFVGNLFGDSVNGLTGNFVGAFDGDFVNGFIANPVGSLVVTGLYSKIIQPNWATVDSTKAFFLLLKAPTTMQWLPAFKIPGCAVTQLGKIPGVESQYFLSNSECLKIFFRVLDI